MNLSRHVIGVFILVPLFFASQAFADTDPLCAPAAATASPQTCDQLYGLAAGTAKSPGDKTATMTPDACAAKKFLYSRYVGAAKGVDGNRLLAITGLDNAFAVNLRDMLCKAPMKIDVLSGFRTKTGNSAVGGAGKSNHLSGCAVDLNYERTGCGSSQWDWVNRNAGTFKIQLPTSRTGECNHIEPVGVCNGDSMPAPSATPTPAATTPFQSALTTLGSTVTPPATTQCPTGYTLTNGQCYPSQTTATQSPYSYAPSSQTTGTAATTATTPVSTTNTVSSSGTGNTNSSASDLITSLANPSVAATTSPVGTAVALNAALSNPSPLATTPQPAVSGTLALQTQSAQINTTQTFTSPDLNQSQSASNISPTSNTFGVLETLKQTLLKIVGWLKSFGNKPVATPAVPTENPD